MEGSRQHLSETRADEPPLAFPQVNFSSCLSVRERNQINIPTRAWPHALRLIFKD